MTYCEDSFSLVVPDGSMQEKVVELSKTAGYPLVLTNSRGKSGYCPDPAISDFGQQRPLDIPFLVARGRYDVGITGLDMLAESGMEDEVEAVARLPISRQTDKKSRLALIVARDSGFKALADLPVDCLVATEYPNTASKYFFLKGRSDIKIMDSCGNTESKIKLFGAVAIVDLVETGNSLVANGLVEIDLVLETEMVVIVNKKVMANPKKMARIDCYVRSLLGALRAKECVRLEVNLPQALVEPASRIIGGLKKATICSLVQSGWFAMIAVVPCKDQNRIISELLTLGVDDICRSEIGLVMTQEN